MKKIFRMNAGFRILFILFPLCTSLFAQVPTYNCEIRNESFVSSSIFEFDIVLTNTGATPFELAGINTGIIINSEFINGGIITPSIVGGSELNTSQIPTNIAFDQATRCLKIAPRVPPRDPITGVTSGTMISSTAGTTLCRVRLSNNVNFGNDPLLYTWNLSPQPYNTIVAAFIPSTSPKLNSIITAAQSQSKSNSVTLFIEGLYLAGTGNNKARNETGFQFAGPVSDLMSVSLASSTTPYNILFTTSDLLLYSNGKCSFSIPGNLNSSYYIVINHRNSIETWSALPVSFATNHISYNFSSAASQAYGNNLKNINSGIFAIYSGDVVRDGIVDGSDMGLIDNASAAPPLTGYTIQDLTGDGIVDGSDMGIIDNNSAAPPIFVRKPL